MGYFCLCSHKRGIHDDPLKDSPGKCNFLNCGCSKYNSKMAKQPWHEKPVHIREFIYQLGLWVLGSIICMTLTTNIKQLFLLPITLFIFISTIFYFVSVRPFNKINKQEALEK